MNYLICVYIANRSFWIDLSKCLLRLFIPSMGMGENKHKTSSLFWNETKEQKKSRKYDILIALKANNDSDSHDNNETRISNNANWKEESTNEILPTRTDRLTWITQCFLCAHMVEKRERQ